MYIFELSKQILRDMNARKMRSALALFGIVWGTLAVVVLLAVGEGFVEASKQNLASVLNNNTIAWPSRTSIPYKGLPSQRELHVKAADVVNMAAAIAEIKWASPTLTKRSVAISQADQHITQHVYGVGADYGVISQLEPALGGRFLSRQDILQSRNVAFIGDNVARTLFADVPAIFQQITIDKQIFTVIGVLNEEDTSISMIGDQKNFILIPYSTYINRWGDQNINNFIFTPEKPYLADAAIDNVYLYLANRFHFDPQDRSTLWVFNPAETANFFYWFIIGIQIFLSLCGVLTLIVGGIGVANIMFLIVRERTQEIGLRMALGAQPKHIMLQIFLEASIIVALGAIIGFVLAQLIIDGLTLLLPSWLGSPTISMTVAGFTLFVLAILTFVAGYFPAKRAVELDPVVALNFR